MQRFAITIIGLAACFPLVASAAVWVEPSCDPSDDPSACNISAPLNVSDISQTKSGALTITGALTASSTLNVTGTSTLDTTNLGTLTVAGTSSTFNSQAIFNNTLRAANRFVFSGTNTDFTISADSIDDNEVSNTLTSSIFIGTGSTSNAVDLATGEVAGTLPSASVEDVWVNTTGDTMTGTLTVNPSATTKGITIVAASSDYPLNITSTGTAARAINVTSSATNGYGILANASGTSSIGVAGVGTNYGVTGASTTGTGGYFASLANNGTSVQVQGPLTGSTAKGLSVTAVAGYGTYVSATGTSTIGGYYTTNGTSSTTLSVNNTGDGGTGITVATTGTGTGINVDTSTGLAIEANNDDIHTTGAYRGGQFYPAGNTSGELYGNALPAVVDTINMSNVVDSAIGGTLAFDGSDIWIGAGLSTDFGIYGVAVQRINAYNGNTTAYYQPASPGFVWQAGAIVYADDRMYVFASVYHTEYLAIGQEADSGSSISGTLSTALEVRSAAYDGEDIWLGAYGDIYKLDNRTTQELVDTGAAISEVVDMLFVDGYIWALDPGNEALYKIDRDSGSSLQEITISPEATDLEFDGAFIWVANNDDVDTTLTRVDITDGSTEQIDLAPTVSNADNIAFDGVRLWIVDNSTLHGYNIAKEQLEYSVDLSSNEGHADVIFDGQYLWVSDGNTVDKVAIGGGRGYSMPAYPKGIIMYGNDDNYHCVYFDSSGNLQDTTNDLLMSNCR